MCLHDLDSAAIAHLVNLICVPARRYDLSALRYVAMMNKEKAKEDQRRRMQAEQRRLQEEVRLVWM